MENQSLPILTEKTSIIKMFGKSIEKDETGPV